MMKKRNIHASARHLPKSDLGGVIFGCKHTTINECLTKQLFGLPAQHFLYVRKIDPGLPLFLFNYSDRKLHGIFESVSPGMMNINPYGWTDGNERTQYPAQVQTRVQLQCQPLLEEKFKPLIASNYYTHHHFWFELDHAQASKLMSLLASLAIAPRTSVPRNVGNRRKNFQPLPTSDRTQEDNRFKLLAAGFENDKVSSWESDSSDAILSANGAREEDDLVKPFALDIEQYDPGSNTYSGTSDGGDQGLGSCLDMKVVDQDDKDLMLRKLKDFAFNNEGQDLSSTDCVNELTAESDVHLEEQGFLGVQPSFAEKNEENGCSASHCQIMITKLILEMEDLKAFKVEQALKMGELEQKLVEAETEIRRLKDHLMVGMVESASCLAMEHKNEKFVKSLDELHFDGTESIYLVGGYDGESWLSTLDLYCPSLDDIKSLKPMNFVRSYASVAVLNNELYVFGGGDGHSWYNTVESYCPSDDRWTSRPPLNASRGSLAGATINNKIFAIGGGNGVECFSDVEMLDLDIGQWIRTRSMLQKRFALAAVELNGVLYATGGYDGKDYMNSVERFDPREHHWTRIASMNTRRACHSLVVLNGKLYALGGGYGSEMISSTEIYDPRLGRWMSGEPMNHCRGYLGAAIVKESIYVIGGLKVGVAGPDIGETVECFKEGRGWEEINSTAIGKRCFMSAIAL